MGNRYATRVDVSIIKRRLQHSYRGNSWLRISDLPPRNPGRACRSGWWTPMIIRKKRAVPLIAVPLLSSWGVDDLLSQVHWDRLKANALRRDGEGETIFADIVFLRLK